MPLFDLCGGHPALNLVNSLDNRYRADGPNEMLPSYGDLLRFLRETDLLDAEGIRLLGRDTPPDARERALQSVRELREAAARVLYGTLEATPPAPHDLRVLESYLLEASRHRQLHWTPTGVTWSWSPAARGDPDLPVWILATAVADILLSDRLGRVRTCALDTCRWLFLDTSKNHTRRWCNMKVCGNRVKARRFQARHES